jgi:hypothetical protein
MALRTRHDEAAADLLASWGAADSVKPGGITAPLIAYR